VARIAFCGLGAMGAPMARRLVEAGHDVAVWNRTLARAESFAGAAGIAESPADAARGAEAVITCLATPDAVSDVVLGADGAASTLDGGLIEMSTIGPDHLTVLAEQLPGRVELVDAPVLGSVANAQDGTLKIFVGASEERFARWRSLLEPLGTPIRVGPTGSGAAMKLVANSTLAGLMGTIGEALALADGFELDAGITLEMLLDSPIGPALRRKLDKIESDHFTASFRLALMLKDMRLVLDAARQRSVDLGLAEASTRWLEAAEARGLGDLDYSAVVAQVRQRDATG
jgi:3-hydroxyisobutyrate dehydrogenase/2-hydroxy-3-oxopropionate reductase